MSVFESTRHEGDAYCLYAEALPAGWAGCAIMSSFETPRLRWFNTSALGADVELSLRPESAHAVADAMQTSCTAWVEAVAEEIRAVADIVEADDLVELVVIEVPGDVVPSLESELSAAIERMDVLTETGSVTIH